MDASENVFDAVVVGGGPAGSCCAALLAKRGARVLLLEKEKFPRDKPCGDALGAKALAVIDELGLREKISKKAFLRSGGIIFSSPSGHFAKIGEGEEGGFVCKRAELDSILFSHAKQVCTAIEGEEVVDVIFEGERAVGVCSKDQMGEAKNYYAKLIVGADGANSVVARKVGAAFVRAEHLCSAVRGYYSNVEGLGREIEVHFLPECMPGYFWVFPLSSHEANIGVGMLVLDLQKKKLNLWKVLQDCMKNKRFKGRFEKASLQGELKGWSLPLASAKRKCAGNGWALVGDAASLVDPFSGEGIGNAMKSARILARTIGKKLQEGDLPEGEFERYCQELWKEIEVDISNSMNLQRLGRHSFLLDLIIGKAGKSEWLRRELSTMLVESEAKGKAKSPLFYLRALLS
ncbi:MAG: NAD(P)/FAD-dependent oxidoreductase [Candidatus Micrarchaeota archaeon]|nr:NAD(P)/FAD-dependent oxidoreductase [Candidatus Micrarchaeota archaeon]